MPGAGQFYTGRPRDGLIALLINGALIWAAAEAFGDDLVQPEVEAMTAQFRRRRDYLVGRFRKELPGVAILLDAPAAAAK